MLNFQARKSPETVLGRLPKGPPEGRIMRSLMALGYWSNESIFTPAADAARRYVPKPNRRLSYVPVSSHDGFASDWHMAHLGIRAIGGAGLVMMEATAVEARGRIRRSTKAWKDEHLEFLSRIAAFLKAIWGGGRNSIGARGAQGKRAAFRGRGARRFP